MKKACFGFAMICIFGLTACGFDIGELPPLPTFAVEADLTEAPVPTINATEVPEPTVDIKPTTVVPTPTVVLSPTVAPTSTVTPTTRPTEISEPTAVPTAKPTIEPTATPAAKLTAKPIPTATPILTSTTTPTATKKPVSPEIVKLLEQGEVHRNTVIRGEVWENEADANVFLREKTLSYSSFAVIVKNVEDLHSAEEYMAMYPEIEKMTIEKIDSYDNGFCAVFKDVETVYDANLCYAIRTGDRSVLTDIEKEIYAYLNEVLNETDAGKLEKVEKVKAFHDYLVLELKYDDTFQTISHSPEGVMKNRRAVCDGYARTMRLLLLMTDVESKIISGTVEGQPHAWNLVKMDDGWYHVDVTWDDPLPDVEGRVGYLYFLKNDRDMAKTHIWESEISCTKNNYQIYMYRDSLCDSWESLRSVYESQIGTKEYLLFCYPKRGTLNRDLILDFLMEELQSGLTYYPEKELEDYLVLEVINPLWE